MKQYRKQRELKDPWYKKQVSDKSLAYYYKNKEAINKKRREKRAVDLIRKAESKRLFNKR